MRDNTILVFLGLIAVVLLVTVFILGNETNYMNDPKNCGAQDNECMEGDICVKAQCVSEGS